MELTYDNKRKFFAQYWGQRCGLGVNKQIDTLTNQLWAAQSAFTESLLLKSLENLEDNCDKTADQLRFEGYAVPWLGLSVQDLINAGWVVLIE